MRGFTLEELEGVRWGEPESESHLVVTCHRLRKKPVDAFSVAELIGKIREQAESSGNSTGLCAGISRGWSSSCTRRTYCTGIGDRSHNAMRRFSGTHRDIGRRGENRPRKNPVGRTCFRPRYFRDHRDATADTPPRPLRSRQGRQTSTKPQVERAASFHLSESSGSSTRFLPGSTKHYRRLRIDCLLIWRWMAKP